MNPSPQPGDFCVCSAGAPIGPLITWLEHLNGARTEAAYEHAFIYVGNGQIVQAKPDGAVLSPLTGRALELWSTGLIPLTDLDRRCIVAVAKSYTQENEGEGVPYSFLDYAALALHHFRLNVPGLQDYIADTGHMICSQLVDQCYQDAGVHLFADGRWPGYVTPADLAQLLLTRKALAEK